MTRSVRGVWFFITLREMKIVKERLFSAVECYGVAENIAIPSVCINSNSRHCESFFTLPRKFLLSFTNS